MKIFNVNVYGEKESVIASGYPMRVSLPTEETYKADPSAKREHTAKNLASAKIGSGHDNFLKGIIVQFDIQYPQYFTPQFQRYHFADIVSSMSKMHCLTKFNLDDMCNKYTSKLIIDNLKKLVEIYNFMNDNDHSKLYITYDLNDKIKGYSLDAPNGKDIYSKEVTKYDVFMMVTSDCPMGFEMVMRVTTNLQQLKTMYHQRRHHKLKDDWGVFCDWLEELPEFQKWVLQK